VLEGDVVMAGNYALDPHDLDLSFRLACQAMPTSPALHIDFDA
jgi:hypothetical protein